MTATMQAPKKTQAAARPAPLPFRTLDSFPEWVEARDKLASLRARRDDLQRRIDVARQPEDRERWLTAQAEALLRGDRAGPDPTAARRATLAELEPHLPIIERAIELAEARLAEVTREYSMNVCEDLLPAYRDLARQLAEATVKLWRLAGIGRATWDALAAEGITRTGAIVPAYPTWPGDLRDQSASAAGCHFLKTLIEAGLLDAAQPCLEGTAVYRPRA